MQLFHFYQAPNPVFTPAHEIRLLQAFGITARTGSQRQNWKQRRHTGTSSCFKICKSGLSLSCSKASIVSLSYSKLKPYFPPWFARAHEIWTLHLSEFSLSLLTLRSAWDARASMPSLLHQVRFHPRVFALASLGPEKCSLPRSLTCSGLDLTVTAMKIPFLIIPSKQNLP